MTEAMELQATPAWPWGLPPQPPSLRCDAGEEEAFPWDLREGWRDPKDRHECAGRMLREEMGEK